MLLDPYNRRLNYLRISLTDRCNLRCVYCMPEQGVPKLIHEDILTYEELLRLARLSVRLGIEKIRLTGGEPLVRKNIGDLIKVLGEIPGIRDISLTTNGVLLAEQAQALWAAGVKRINISLDTLNPGKYAEITRFNLFDQVWAGIQEAERIGFSPIKVNVVALRGINDNEILAFGRLSQEKPYHVRFIEFMPVGTENGWSTERFLSSDDIFKKLQVIGPLYPVNGQGLDGPAKRMAYDGARGEIGLISPISEHFCPSCNRLRLTAEGRLRVCIFSDDEIDLRTPLRNGASDVELETAIRTAILQKPKEHPIQMNPLPRKCQRQMSKIGG
ncbi:MAG: cyclic pyranopterin phosphate synthase MoaA [Deltaproteobacteria bacterium RBG_13_43_22]|nr:MAG: cyclic pyranopterin phosphate synthase MoaA [Deltaproteobacteria bacterium RBG_13_43_22]